MNAIVRPTIRLRVVPRLIPINGKSVELQSTATAIQWRLAGTDDDWTDLVALADITGPQGDEGPPGQDGIMASVVAGTNTIVDSTDPANPVVSADAPDDDDLSNDPGKLALRGNVLANIMAKSVSDAAGLTPVAAPDFINVAGYAAAGDGGGGPYQKVASEPSHAAKFSITQPDTTVVWYEARCPDGRLNARRVGVTFHGTNDETTAMQNAIDAASALGAELVGVGTVVVSTIYTPADFTIRALKRRKMTIKRVASGTGQIIRMSGDGLSLIGVIVDGNKANAASGSYAVYNSDPTGTPSSHSNLRIEDCQITNNKGSGVMFRAFYNTVSDFHVVRSKIDLNDGSGVELYQDSSYQITTARVEDNQISSNGVHGISVNGAGGTGTTAHLINYFSFERNFCNNNGSVSNSGHGIMMFLVGSSAANRIVPGWYGKISHNVCNFNIGGGIQVASDNCEVVGNECNGSGDHVTFPPIVSGITCVGSYCTVVGNTCTTNDLCGIDMGLSRYSTCSGNVVSNNGAAGINIEATQYLTCTGNTLFGNGNLFDFGVYNTQISVHSGSTAYPFDTKFIVLANNTIAGSGTYTDYGIRVFRDAGAGASSYAIDNVKIVGNHVVNAGAVGDIMVDDFATNVTLDANTTRDTGKTETTYTSNGLSLNHGTDQVILGGSSKTLQWFTSPSGRPWSHGERVRCFFKSASVTVSTGGNFMLSSASATPAAGSMIEFMFARDVITKIISGATNANPGVFTTSAAHGLVVGDFVKFASLGGMTDVNGTTYIVNTVPTTTTFTVKSLDGTVLNTTSFGTYTSGGSITVHKWVEMTRSANSI